MIDVLNVMYALTTTDNPYHPVDQFSEWYVFDTSKGYNTLPLLARVVRSSNDLSDADQAHAIDEAIHDIVRENVSGMHTKIKVS